MNMAIFRPNWICSCNPSIKRSDIQLFPQGHFFRYGSMFWKCLTEYRFRSFSDLFFCQGVPYRNSIHISSLRQIRILCSSVLILIRKLLQSVNELPDMDSVNKRMMCLDWDRDQNMSVFFIILSPVKQRSGIILLAWIRVRNMRIRHPRHRRTLKHIIWRKTTTIWSQLMVTLVIHVFLGTIMRKLIINISLFIISFHIQSIWNTKMWTIQR